MAVKKPKIIVVGGGPGGMYAAITASERGHHVHLVEKTDSLGGVLKFTDFDNFKRDLSRYKNSLINRLNRLDVDVKTGVMVTPEFVEHEDPDALIVAIGSQPIVPDIPGVSGSNVMHALDVYWEPEKIGEKVVMIGGGLVGCETGLHLSAQGRSVTIVEMMERLAVDAT